jgi:hypothetical protein
MSVCDFLDQSPYILLRDEQPARSSQLHLSPHFGLIVFLDEAGSFLVAIRSRSDTMDVSMFFVILRC